MKTRKFATFALMLVVGVSSLAGAATKDVVEIIPDNALGFLVIDNLAEADAKASKLGGKVGAPPASPLAMFKMFNAGLQGFDDNGTAAAVIVPWNNSTVVDFLPVICLPVTDYDAFLKSVDAEEPIKKIAKVTFFGETSLCAKKGSFALVTAPDGRGVLKAFLKSDKSVADTIGDDAKSIAEQDAAVVFLQPGIEKFFAVAQDGLNEVKQMLEGDPDGELAAQGIDIYVRLFEFMEAEVTQTIVGVQLDDKGAVRVVKHVKFKPDGSIAPLLKKAKPNDVDLLAGLPADPFVMAIGAQTPGELYEPLMDWSADVMKAMPQLYGLKPDQIDAMMKDMTELTTSMGDTSFFLGVGKPGDGIYSNMSVTMKVDDAQKYITEYRKMMQQFAEQADAESAVFGSMKAENVDLGDGVTGVKLVMDTSKFVGATGNDPAVAEMMKAMFGNDGNLAAHIVAVDKETLITSYTSAETTLALAKAVRAGKPGLSADSNVKKTISLLPDGSQCVGLMSVDGTIAFINRILGLVPDVPAEVTIPEFPASPPIGFSMKVSPAGLQGDMVLPAELIEQIGEYVKKIQQMQQIEREGI